jgi:hypothetical protein
MQAQQKSVDVIDYRVNNQCATGRSSEMIIERIGMVGGGSFFRDSTASLGGPLSFRLSRSRGLTGVRIILRADIPVGIV